jgi:hypothetical protein
MPLPKITDIGVRDAGDDNQVRPRRLCVAGAQRAGENIRTPSRCEHETDFLRDRNLGAPLIMAD